MSQSLVHSSFCTFMCIISVTVTWCKTLWFQTLHWSGWSDMQSHSSSDVHIFTMCIVCNKTTVPASFLHLLVLVFNFRVPLGAIHKGRPQKCSCYIFPPFDRICYSPSPYPAHVSCGPFYATIQLRVTGHATQPAAFIACELGLPTVIDLLWWSNNQHSACHAQINGKVFIYSKATWQWQ